MRYLHRNEWFGYGVLTGAAVVASLPLFPYQWHVFLHIAGAVVFLGNIIVTGVWMLLAERTRSIPVIHFSAKAVIRADFLFTLPGVLLLVMNGLVMVVARWGGWDAFHQSFLDHHRSGVVHRIRGHMAWHPDPGPTSHGRILRPVGLSRRAAIAVLLRDPSVVFLGRTGDCAAPVLALPDGAQAGLRLRRCPDLGHLP